jgi:hypothetical protein
MEAKLEGKTLTLKIELSDGQPSHSGKTIVVATTSGFTDVPGTNLRISYNVIKPRKGG